MFRLIRILFLILIAFLGGIFFERAQVRELCGAAGGTLTRGLCIGELR
jgi:hypothetical protein